MPMFAAYVASDRYVIVTADAEADVWALAEKEGKILKRVVPMVQKSSRTVVCKRVDDAELRRLWMIGLPEKEIAARLGHHRSVVRRRAATMHLPTLQQVRLQLAHTLDRRQEPSGAS